MLRSCFALSIALALSGCEIPTYSLVRPGSAIAAGTYRVDTGIAWSSLDMHDREVWTVDGLPLEALYFYEGLDPGETLAEVDYWEPESPEFGSGATAIDVSEFVVDSLTVQGFAQVEAVGLRPAGFGGVEGFRFEFDYLTETGLEGSGLVAGAVVGDRLYMIMYTGTRAYHFAKYRDDVERIVNSVRPAAWQGFEPAPGSAAAGAVDGAGLPAASGRIADPELQGEADVAGYYGAIAVGTTSTFRSGACVNEPTLEAAQSCALRECGQHCQVHVAFADGQCAMVAGQRGGQGVRSDDPRNRWRLGDAGVGDSPAAAREAAMDECRRHNRNCRQLVSPICNQTPDQATVGNQPERGIGAVPEEQASAAAGTGSDYAAWVSAEPQYYGAVAISTKTVFRSGACVDQPTAQSAESCALRECGSFCEVRTVFGNGQCAAIAGTRERQRPEDIAIGASATAARETAMSQCRSHPQTVGRSYWSNRCELMAPTICNLTPEPAAIARQAERSIGAVPEEQASAAAETGSDHAARASAEPQYFGAIAVSTTSTFKSGACVNEPTLEAAQSCALRECGQHCEVHVAFAGGQCAMVAGRRGGQGVRSDDPRNRWRLGDAGVGDSPAAAREVAMDECRRHNRNCRELVRPTCNG